MIEALQRKQFKRNIKVQEIQKAKQFQAKVSSFSATPALSCIWKHYLYKIRQTHDAT